MAWNIVMIIGAILLAFKIHALGNKAEQPKVLSYFKNIRIITDKPASYVQAMDLPARGVE